MNLRNLIFGIAITTVLMIALVATRLFKFDTEAETLKLEELQLVTLAPPPEPEMDEPEPEETPPPPPTPALQLTQNTIEMAELTLPVSMNPTPPDMTVDLFTEDVAPPKIPIKAPSTPKKTKPKVVKRTPPKITQQQSVGISDLDKKPTIVRKGKFRWPSSAKSTVAQIKVKVEINERGSLRLISILSMPDPSYESTIRQFVRTTRYTPPRHEGKPVKVQFILPATLRKQ